MQCKEGVAPIKVITSFTSFPYVGRPWNLYLLESYVKRFSRRYCIKGGSPARTANVGVICLANDDRDYNDVVAQVLANSSLKLEEHAVGDYLVRLGFVVKKTTFVKKMTGVGVDVDVVALLRNGNIRLWTR